MARYYGMSRKYSRNTDKFISGLFKVGSSMASAYAKEAKRQKREQERQVASYNRLLAQLEREELRQIKQHEMALRRAEREREKAERERDKAAKLQARLDEQKRIEEEISEIEDNNYLWTNVQAFISQIVTVDDINAQEITLFIIAVALVILVAVRVNMDNVAQELVLGIQTAYAILRVIAVSVK